MTQGFRFAGMGKFNAVAGPLQKAYYVYKASRTPGGQHAQRVLMRRFAPKLYNRRVRRDYKYRNNYLYNRYISIHSA